MLDAPSHAIDCRDGRADRRPVVQLLGEPSAQADAALADLARAAAELRLAVDGPAGLPVNRDGVEAVAGLAVETDEVRQDQVAGLTAVGQVAVVPDLLAHLGGGRSGLLRVVDAPAEALDRAVGANQEHRPVELVQNDALRASCPEGRARRRKPAVVHVPHRQRSDHAVRQQTLLALQADHTAQGLLAERSVDFSASEAQLALKIHHGGAAAAVAEGRGCSERGLRAER